MAKDLELIVEAVIAGVSNKHSVLDSDPRKRLSTLGIKNQEMEELKKRLFETVSSEGLSGFAEFSAKLAIKPTSTVAEVATRLRKAHVKPLKLDISQGSPRSARVKVRAAVHTAVAQAADKVSIIDVRPQDRLRDLGLRSFEIPEIKRNLYRMLYSTPNARGLKQFARNPRITIHSTVADIADATLGSFDIADIRGKDFISLAGKEGRRGKGGFGAGGGGQRPARGSSGSDRALDSLGGDETRHGKGW